MPAYVLASLGGTPELAAELVAAGLWRRTKNGYVFHDWLDWGHKRTAEQIRQLRQVRAEAGRKGGMASGRKRANTVNSSKQTRSKPDLLRPDGESSPDPPTTDDVGKGASKPEANPKQLASQLVSGGLNPKAITSTTPQPPAAGAAGGGPPCDYHQRTLGHRGVNCRACGTNPRGQPDPPPPSAAERHQSARPITEARLAAGLPPGNRPASDETKHAIAEQVRRELRERRP